MRTLIISDLHLGNRLGHDILSRPAPRAALLDSLEDVDRLVLLGDTMELMHVRPETSMARAEPVLRAIGVRLPREARIILVPGNHDLPLIRPWVRANAGRLGVDTLIPTDATPRLKRVVGWLGGPERVEVRYPGVWIDAGVFATHGHYLDQHLRPESAYGLLRGALRGRRATPARPADYERRPRPAINRLPRPLAAVLDDGVDLAGQWFAPRFRRLLLRRRMAPITSRLLALQMRRASVPAIVQVVQRLGVDARWLIYGHVHRVGPLAGDGAPWQPGDGGPVVLNTGSWVHEPILVHGATPPHPYWPGGAVWIENGSPPRATGLLDDLDAEALRSRRLP
jgi:UDP-2,3-diacylglucosamine pyrophosphatase LpxH